MKNLLKSIAFAVAFTVVFVSNTFADDKETKKAAFGTGIFASKSGKIHINLDKYTDHHAVVLVTDARGTVIYREVVGKEVSKFRKALNLQELPSGEYTIEVSGKDGKVTRRFELSEQSTERSLAIK
ncbi:DUF3244 domain-containing protein [Dyadobacter crusticola]|uniref:DUF3244 domain-containing protein n=1 Tax=Dyadobacter crusticola TaxID=292407 RepID=UPI0004E23189|nr:hypothetical protein [Dyadobacter crusticola]